MNTAKHIAIIMDGNGRWAESKNLKRVKGHEKGAEVIRLITTYCAQEEEIDYLTLYAFSTENWKRPKLEVEFLMKLLSNYLAREEKTYIDNGICFKAIGDTTRFSKKLQSQISALEDATKNCTKLTQFLALNYGAKDEIVRAVNTIRHEEVTQERLNNALDCQKDIDILIRTGGDHRISNFMLWQAAYAELFFTPILWPDFTTIDMCHIIDEYKTIERRFGGLK